MRIVRRILWGLAALLIVLQFFQIDKTNPETDPSKDFFTLVGDAPEDVAYLVKTVCYDCHSHETKYPWYTYIAPINWWIKDHINHGREKLNFSTFGDYPARRAAHKLEECHEEIEKGTMPLKSYTWMHTEARLTPQQETLLINWFKEQEKNWK